MKLSIFLTALVLASSVGARAVILPVEVKSGTGTAQKKISVSLPTGNGAKVRYLWAQVHNLTWENKLTIQVNTLPAVSVTNTSVEVLGLGRTYGGIGGSFPTITFRMVVPPLPDGTNAITWRFGGQQYDSIGFEVVKFNFQDTNYQNLVPPQQFKQEEPNLWQPPLSSAVDIAEGQRLFTQAFVYLSPMDHTLSNLTCADCHTRTGMDLKFFNYSNTSIIERTMFHGFFGPKGKKDLKGRQIASYIRTLAVPNPGRPWNPPYQPGPGLDSKSWAAGAGLDWVLQSDTDTLKYLFPNGIDKSAIAVTNHLNIRELPISLQLPDWNHWLPRRHPKDTWGDAWTTSEIPTRYEALRQKFADTQGLAAYLASQQSKIDVNTWQQRDVEFLVPRTETPGIVWSRSYADGVYGSQQWMAVRMFEMVMQFGLEGYSTTYFGANTQNETRTWFDRITFKLAPTQLKIPDSVGVVGVGDAHTIALVNEYLNNAWYYVQLVLNPGNGTSQGTSPIDWGYTWGRFKDLWDATRTDTDQIGVGEIARYTAYFAKGMQEWAVPGNLDATVGWNPDNKVTIDWPATPTPSKQWLMVPPTTAGQVFTAIMGSWLDYSMSFTNAQWYATGWIDPLYKPIPNYNGTLGDRWLYMLTAYKPVGVDQPLLDKCSAWCKGLMPAGIWPVSEPTDAP